MHKMIDSLKKSAYKVIASLLSAWLIWISSSMVQVKTDVARIATAVEMHLKEPKTAKITASLGPQEPAAP